MRCAVYGCTADNQSKHFTNEIHFFRFPSNKTMQLKWKHLCRRADDLNVTNARICSKHFCDSDYERNLKHELLGYVPKSYRPLKKDAVPSKNLLFKTREANRVSERAQRQEKRQRKQLVENLLKGSEDDWQSPVKAPCGTRRHEKCISSSIIMGWQFDPDQCQHDSEKCCGSIVKQERHDDTEDASQRYGNQEGKVEDIVVKFEVKQESSESSDGVSELFVDDGDEKNSPAPARKNASKVSIEDTDPLEESEPLHRMQIIPLKSEQSSVQACLLGDSFEGSEVLIKLEKEEPVSHLWPRKRMKHHHN